MTGWRSATRTRIIGPSPVARLSAPCWFASTPCRFLNKRSGALTPSPPPRHLGAAASAQGALDLTVLEHFLCRVGPGQGASSQDCETTMEMTGSAAPVGQQPITRRYQFPTGPLPFAANM